MGHYRIAVLTGDGIGPEVVPEAVRVLQVAADVTPGVDLDFVPLPVGLTAYETYGTTLPVETVEALGDCHGWLLGPLTTHIYTGRDTQRNVSAVLRTEYELFANIRPAKSYSGVAGLQDTVDLVVVRENTEGFYADRNMADHESGEVVPADGVALAMRVITRQACERIAVAGFELARRRKAVGSQGLVTLVHKANVLRKTDGLFLETCRHVARDYPDIAVNDLHVDAAALHLIMRPETFDVIVTTNMFGDILSDAAAGLVGGLGLAPGLNAGHDRAMAQAVHGSAPDLVGQQVANPTALILSGALLLDWLAGQHEDSAITQAAQMIERAVDQVLATRAAATPDLGGTSTTTDFGGAVAAAVRAFAAQDPR